MLDWIKDLIVKAWDKINPVVIINPYESGLVLTLGKHSRNLHPGLNFKWPFIDTTLVICSVTTTMQLAPQTLVTADGHSVVISTIVRYSVQDVVPYLLNIYDSHDVLNDVIQGYVRVMVSDNNYADVVKNKSEAVILKKARRDVKKFGVDIERIVFADIGKVRSLRLIQG